jgi:hypothetical protein
MAVYAASQLAGVVPGLHGASPRDAALAAGLVTLGVPWSAALGAIGLMTLTAWLPALALGGGSFVLAPLLRRWRARFTAHRTPLRARPAARRAPLRARPAGHSATLRAGASGRLVPEVGA